MAEFPDWLEPMAATLTQERFSGPDWIFERKLDGIRMLAFKNRGAVHLFSRNRLSLDASYPAVVKAIAALPHQQLILDGEATAGWEHTNADYHVFDVLWIDGRDLRSLPLVERREQLARMPLGPPLGRVPALDIDRPWDHAAEQGWEGVIAKRRDSRYEHRRSPHWVKMKCEESQELVVGGFTDPQGKRVGLGALLLGYFEGDDLWFAGKLGTGFDTKMLVSLRAELDALEIPKPPFTKGKGLPRLRAHWVRPEIVVQVGFIEWTGHGKLRHPRLLGIRRDKAARDVVRERS